MRSTTYYLETQSKHLKATTEDVEGQQLPTPEQVQEQESFTSEHGQEQQLLAPAKVQNQQPPTPEQPRPQSQHPFTPESQEHATLASSVDAIGRNLAYKKGRLILVAALFEDMAWLYDAVSEAAEGQTRTSLNDWVEDLSLVLLEMLQHLEDGEAEVKMIEDEYRKALQELEGLV